MKSLQLLTSAAVVALLSALPALAQEKKDGPLPGPGPSAPRAAPEAPPPQARPNAERPPQARQPAERPKAEMPQRPQAVPKGNAEGQPSRQQPQAQKPQPDRNAQQKQPENKKADVPDKAVPQPKAAAPQDKSAPKNAETERGKRPDTAQQPQPGSPTADKAGGERNRVHITEQQRVDVHRDVLKERNVNRVRVNTEVRVGLRVPRSVRLAVLPASVVAVVPAYRTYRYFVADDRICIVEPTTYEIVDVITPSSQVATHPGLQLSAQEQQIILREVDLGAAGSTLGLGALSEGASVPRNVQLLDLPVTVVDRIPRLNSYKYFVAEQQVAIVDPAGASVQALVEITRQ